MGGRYDICCSVIPRAYARKVSGALFRWNDGHNVVDEPSEAHRKKDFSQRFFFGLPRVGFHAFPMNSSTAFMKVSG